jgi:diadenosine tetraphosphate (Ap4A) HIT family hydrolase
MAARGAASSSGRRVLAPVPKEDVVPDTCPFCNLSSERILFENEHALVLRDGFPISPGHTLIVPKRHVGSFFDTTDDEERAIFAALRRAHADLLRECATGKKRRPDGFNIGVNDGAAAGQTVLHLHVHLIPRYAGDVADPRGGVRWIFPEKADYWSGSA